MEQELRRAGAQVLHAAHQTTQGGGVRVEQHVRIGQSAEEIAACAQELGCDGIVMGTRGMGAIAGLALGSVATKVVHLTRVPVTLVK